MSPAVARPLGGMDETEEEGGREKRDFRDGCVMQIKMGTLARSPPLRRVRRRLANFSDFFHLEERKPCRLVLSRV